MPDVELDASGVTTLESVPINQIRPNPHQPRTEFNEEDLEDLTNSVREKGVIQPIVVRDTGTDYEIIAGERRWRAAQRVGMEEIPARVLEINSETEMLELSLIENLQRSNLNPVELALGYKNLSQIWGLTQEEIAQRVGKKRATVANTLRLLDLPDKIMESLRRGEITTGHAKAILALEGPARQSALWKKVIDNNLSVRQTEEAVKTMTEPSSVKSKPTDENAAVYNTYADVMQQNLGTKVRISKKGKKGSIRIEFYSREELERLVELLGRVR